MMENLQRGQVPQQKLQRDPSPRQKISFLQVDPLAEEARRILEERFYEIVSAADPNTGASFETVFVAFVRKDASAFPEYDGYTLDIADQKVLIQASKVREFIAGSGRLLDIIRKAFDREGAGPAGQFLPETHEESLPKYPVRIHYMPAHFGNSFEVAWPLEMQRYMEDMALAGASGYGDWFDPNDMPDPYNPRVYCSSSMTLWRRKKEFLRIAKRLGLDTMLWVAHNVGFVDQLKPEWEGVRSHRHRVQGQVLCPSNPEAREICLKNQDNLFKDLKASGVIVDKVCFGPYDDGGCACGKCQPYYPTFLTMVAELYDIIKKYYPGIRADICGWWASEEEMQQLKHFASNTAGEWFESFQFSATYNVFAIPEDVRGKIGDIRLSTFMHIGFSNDNRDVYFKGGVHSAARRIKTIVNSFEKVGCIGFHTYNESFGDHFNMYAGSRLGRDPGLDIDELIRAYCRQMYSLRGDKLVEMADVLGEMEALNSERAEDWAKELEDLRPYIRTPERQSWSFEHVVLKAEFMRLDRRIGSGKDWEAADDIKPVIGLIRERLTLSERMWREVYGLGILRHAFIPERMLPDWYGNYARLMQVEAGLIVPGAAISKNC